MENTIDNLILTMNQEQVEQVLNIINSLEQEGKYKLSDENKAILSDLSKLTTEEEIKSLAKTICKKEENLAKYIIEKTIEKDKKIDNLTDEQVKYYCEAIIELSKTTKDDNYVKNTIEYFSNVDENTKKELLKIYSYMYIKKAINNYEFNPEKEETEEKAEEGKSISEIFTQGINKFASINQLSKISLLKDLMKEWKRAKKCENKTEKKKKSLIKRIFNKKNLKRAATIALVASSVVLLGSFNPVAAASDFTSLIAVAKVALPVSIAALASTKVVPGIVNLVKKKKSKTKRIKGKVNNNIITDVTKLRLEKILDEFTGKSSENNGTPPHENSDNIDDINKTLIEQNESQVKPLSDNPEKQVTSTKGQQPEATPGSNDEPTQDDQESSYTNLWINTESINKEIAQLDLVLNDGPPTDYRISGENVTLEQIETIKSNLEEVRILLDYLKEIFPEDESSIVVTSTNQDGQSKSACSKTMSKQK